MDCTSGITTRNGHTYRMRPVYAPFSIAADAVEWVQHGKTLPEDLPDKLAEYMKRTVGVGWLWHFSYDPNAGNVKEVFSPVTGEVEPCTLMQVGKRAPDALDRLDAAESLRRMKTWCEAGCLTDKWHRTSAMMFVTACQLNSLGVRPPEYTGFAQAMYWCPDRWRDMAHIEHAEREMLWANPDRQTMLRFLNIAWRWAWHLRNKAKREDGQLRKDLNAIQAPLWLDDWLLSL